MDAIKTEIKLYGKIDGKLDRKIERKIEELADFSIINVDKPVDCTSFDVAHHINKLFSSLGVKKTGHFGTLDPNVTGVLPVCLGRACKLQQYFMKHDKIYIGEMKMHKPISKKELEAGMQKFIGKIMQMPPRKSRVKRQEREREIIEFKLLEFDEKTLIAKFYSHVEAGTYIRKLCDDLGKSLGIGGQMTGLRRIKAGIFSEENLVTIKEIETAVEEYKTEKKEDKLRKILIPAEIILKILDAVEVKESSVKQLFNGSPLFEAMLDEKTAEKSKKIIKSEKVFAVVCKNRIIETAKFTDQFENKEILAKPEVVLN